jgi:carbamoylphosphate synthase small subunit
MKLHEQALSNASHVERAREAALVLVGGTASRGKGLGAFGQTLGEVRFNTSMTGYQEILTDPSHAGQIITFTFSHIGNDAAAPPQYRPVAVTREIQICRLVALATFPTPSLACMWSNAKRSTGCAA